MATWQRRFCFPWISGVARMTSRLSQTLIIAVTALSLMSQSVLAGVLLFRDCCSSGDNDRVSSRDSGMPSCCSQESSACQKSMQCCGMRSKQRQKPVGCHCVADREPLPIVPPSNTHRVQVSLSILMLCNELRSEPLLVPRGVTVEFVKSPIAHSVPPSVQTLFCVWRT